MSTSIGKLSLILSADSQGFGRDLERAKGKVDSFGNDVRRIYDRLSDQLAKKQLLSHHFNVPKTAGLDMANQLMDAKLGSLNAQAKAKIMTPGFADEMAKLELEQQQAQKKYNDALNAARERLAPPTDFMAEAQKLLADHEKKANYDKQLNIAKAKLMPTALQPSKGESKGFALGQSLGLGESASSGLASMGGEIEAMLTTLGPVGLAIGALVAGIGAVGYAAVKLTQTMIGFARTANPAYAERYDRAWADLNAVIGDTFMPVLKLATGGVRLLADFLATILPTGAELEKIFGGFDENMTVLRGLLAEIAPLIKQGLIDGLNWTAETIRDFKAGLEVLRQKLVQVRQYLGFDQQAREAYSGDKPKGLADSRGRAPASVSFVGVAELARANFAKQAQMGSGATIRDQVDMQKETNRILELMRTAIENEAAEQRALGF